MQFSVAVVTLCDCECAVVDAKACEPSAAIPEGTTVKAKTEREILGATQDDNQRHSQYFPAYPACVHANSRASSPESDSATAV
jgi:hypothetical protein